MRQLIKHQLIYYIQPITFPNHWSLVTGLYPEAHGVVGNYFYDDNLNDSFYYKSPDKSWDSKWWGGEPVNFIHASCCTLFSQIFTHSLYRFGLLLCDRTRNLAS